MIIVIDSHLPQTGVKNDTLKLKMSGNILCKLTINFFYLILRRGKKLRLFFLCSSSPFDLPLRFYVNNCFVSVFSLTHLNQSPTIHLNDGFAQ